MENLPVKEDMESASEENLIPIKTDLRKPENVFKKPVLIGKIGKLPKKLHSTVFEKPNTDEENVNNEEFKAEELKNDQVDIKPLKGPVQSPAQQLNEIGTPFHYKEPLWSGLPKSNGKDYIFEVLKNGTIIETINLMSKPFWVFGRLSSCSIFMQHPTISRYHAVLQYRQEASEIDGPGFYIYDLGSTHGTFLNKNRLKPKIFVRMQVGHMLKLGCSTRSYILDGPEYDEEEESELSVTELKQKREDEILKRQEEKLRIEKELEERRKKEEERGVDWGLGEDADEETDLSENPFAQTNNEELYLDDPKKALRGFFEREGLDLEYNCSEQGIGQYLCRVELPIDDEIGRSVVAEVLHKGKKKEAVIQCALEACRILDRYGMLRQATHESRKRKAKNWEDNDYYDSDEDTFLDRTGTIEKKREKRMLTKAPQVVETYESLMEKEKSISSNILKIENELASLQNQNKSKASVDNEEDSLDNYMKGLTNAKADNKSLSDLKSEAIQLRTEHDKVVKLINIVKPANLPALVVDHLPSTSKGPNPSHLPIFGKRKKIQIKFGNKSNYDSNLNNDIDDEDEEKKTEEEDGKVEKEDNERMKSDKTDNKKQKKQEETMEDKKVECDEPVRPGVSPRHADDSSSSVINNVDQDNYSSSSSSSSVISDEENATVRGFTSLQVLPNTMTFKKFESILKKGLPPYAGKHQEKLEKILNNLKKLATNEDRMHVDWKILSAKKKKVMKLISDMRALEPDDKLEHRVSSELNRILLELNSMTEQKYKVLDKVKKMGNEIQTISEAIEKDFKDYKKEVKDTPEVSDNKKTVKSESKETRDDSNKSNRFSENEDTIEENTEKDEEEKKKKKNQKRIQQRQGKVELERQRGYEEDASRENYSMWMPPSGQSGDGRTNLNEKYGY